MIILYKIKLNNFHTNSSKLRFVLLTILLYGFAILNIFDKQPFVKGGSATVFLTLNATIRLDN